MKNKEKDEQNEYCCDLKFGYQDKEDEQKTHKSVVFGKRPTCGDFIKTGGDAAGVGLQFTLGMAAKSIVEFGGLTMPVSMTVLLSLNKVDRKILLEKYNSFISDTWTEKGEILQNGQVKLVKGFERDGKAITLFEFRNLLTGYDEIEIESESTDTFHNHALQIVKELAVPENFTYAELELLDAEDFLLLKEAEEKWLDSFR